MAIKHLITLSLFFACMYVNAQKEGVSFILINKHTSATITANTVFQIQTQSEETAKFVIDIKNISSSNKTYKVKRYDMQLNSNATATAAAYYCFAGYCYSPSAWLSPSNLTLNSMQSASELPGEYVMLGTYLDELVTTGYSYVKYTVQNVNLADDSIQVAIKYSSPEATGISDQSKPKFYLAIGSIPARETIILKAFELSANAEATILDSAGKTIYKREILKNQALEGFEIDLTGNSKGLYYLTLTSQGKSTTRKLILE